MITREEAKEQIAKAIADVNGCKATELAARADLVEAFGNIGITEAIEELVAEGKIVEVEYILPTMEYRIKSFLLPGGTEVMRVK